MEEFFFIKDELTQTNRKLIIKHFKWTSPQHQIIAKTILLKNDFHKNKNTFLDACNALNKVPISVLKRITMFELQNVYGVKLYNPEWKKS